MKILPALDYKLFEASLAPLWEAQNAAYNVPAEKQFWAFSVEDDVGNVTGGVGGYIQWGWMYVQHLIVAPEHRGKGLGRDLMDKAEALARERGLKGMYLKTLGFQVPEFYSACGFETVGLIEDMPPGSSYHVMAKQFA